MKVQDLKNVKIAPSGQDKKIEIVNGERGYLGCLWGCDLTDFENLQEALKAAALFRASYEMQASLKAAVSRLEYLGETESLTYVRCVAALELSENLK